MGLPHRWVTSITLIGILSSAISQMLLTGFDKGAIKGSTHEVKCSFPDATSYRWIWTSAEQAPRQKMFTGPVVSFIADPAKHEGSWKCEATVKTATHSDWKILFVYCDGATMESSTQTPTQGGPFSVGCSTFAAPIGDLQLALYSVNPSSSHTYPVKQGTVTKSGACQIHLRPNERQWTSPKPCGTTGKVYRLTSNPAQTSDTGYWRCYDTGRACGAFPILITVFVPPKTPVITASSAKIPKEGDFYEMSCDAWKKGVVNITYSWTKNASPVPIANDSRITFSKIGKMDAGSYQCAAVDAIGNRRDSSSHQVVVYYAPYWDPSKKRITKVVEKIGEPMKITLHVLSNPQATLTWYRGSNPLDTSNFIMSTLLSKGSHVLTWKKDIVAEDYGVYSARFATGGVFPVVSIDVVLSAPPGNVSLGGFESGAIVDKPRTLMCDAWQNGAYGITYTWFSDGVKISSGNSSEYTLPSVKKSHGIDYRCDANNGKFITNGTAKLTIYYKPEIDPDKTIDWDDVAKGGDTSSFTVHVVAKPLPYRFRWLKGTKEITTNDKNYLSVIRDDNRTYILFIHKVANADYGKYTAEITNIAGTSIFTFELISRGLFDLSAQEWALRVGLAALGLIIIIIISIVIWRSRKIGWNRNRRRKNAEEENEDNTKWCKRKPKKDLELRDVVPRKLSSQQDIVRFTTAGERKDIPLPRIPEYSAEEEITDKRESLHLPLDDSYLQMIGLEIPSRQPDPSSPGSENAYELPYTSIADSETYTPLENEHRAGEEQFGTVNQGFDGTSSGPRAPTQNIQDAGYVTMRHEETGQTQQNADNGSTEGVTVKRKDDRCYQSNVIAVRSDM